MSADFSGSKMRGNGLIRGACLLLAAISLYGCTSLSGSYPVTDPEAGFKYAQAAIERADWASAYRHLEHNLYVFDDAVMARAMAMIADYPEIADAARASFSKEALNAYTQTHPAEYPWVRIRLEVFENNIATPQEAAWARNNVAEVYAEEIAMSAAKTKKRHTDSAARRARDEAVKAENNRRNIARTCGNAIFGGICLGEPVDELRQRQTPRIDIDDGLTRRLVFDVGLASYGVIAHDNQVMAILRLFPSTSWIDFATHKLRLERAFEIHWERTIRLPEEAEDRESREQAIRDGTGLVKLSTFDRTLVLSMRGPEGIRLANIHPAYTDWFRVARADDPWRVHSILPLLLPSHDTMASSELGVPGTGLSLPPDPVVAVVFRPGTSVQRETVANRPTSDVEDYFAQCVKTAIEDIRPSISLVNTDDLLANTSSGTIEELVREQRDKPTASLPMDVNTLVFVDGRPADDSTMHCDSTSGGSGFAGGCVGSDGLFFCGAGYGGIGCLGLAQFRSPYRLSVTLIDAVHWRAMQYYEALTNEGRIIAAGFLIPAWWTFGPDWAECTDIGRQIAEYLEPAANGD